MNIWLGSLDCLSLIGQLLPNSMVSFLFVSGRIKLEKTWCMLKKSKARYHTRRKISNTDITSYCFGKKDKKYVGSIKQASLFKGQFFCNRKVTLGIRLLWQSYQKTNRPDLASRNSISLCITLHLFLLYNYAAYLQYSLTI